MTRRIKSDDFKTNGGSCFVEVIIKIYENKNADIFNNFNTSIATMRCVQSCSCLLLRFHFIRYDLALRMTFCHGYYIYTNNTYLYKYIYVCECSHECEKACRKFHHDVMARCIYKN